jgi:hypothetical protein
MHGTTDFDRGLASSDQGSSEATVICQNMALAVRRLNVDVVWLKACGAQAPDIKELTEKWYGTIFRIGQNIDLWPMIGRNTVDFINGIVKF